jgi:hypothetical protein
VWANIPQDVVRTHVYASILLHFVGLCPVKDTVGLFTEEPRSTRRSQGC